MKTTVFIILLLSMFSACTPKKHNRLDNIPETDTTCLNARAKAKSDILLRKLAYCHDGAILYISGLRGHTEMDSLLQLYNISSDVAYKDIVSDTPIKGQTQRCYCDFMRESIDKKFGNNFLDSLLKVADSLFLVNNINDTLQVWDTKPNYPTSIDTVDLRDFSETLQEDINSVINYPHDYKPCPNTQVHAYAYLFFIVDKLGNGNLKDIDFTFDIKSNKKFEKYFEKQIRKGHRKTGWTPATIRNQNVISEVMLIVYFK